MTSPARYVMAIDQGTTSSRAILFDHDGTVVSVAQREHDQSFPRAGWVEHDATEIRDNVMAVVADAMSEAEAGPGDVAAIGITNQRETTVVWDKATGEPVAPAIVWQDTRTQQICDRLAAEADTDDPAEGVNRYRERTGLPLSTYFAGPHVMWVLENVEGARERAEAGELLMGTIDTWLVWHLTGGVDGGLHVTDVTNASRTLLMNIDTLDWNPDICADMGIPTDMLPRIHSSSEVYGEAAADTGLEGVPIAGILGDQHAATFGQACLEPGQVKNTYGTGCFLLMNTGTEPVASNHGLLTTVAYKIGEEPAAYALEGSIAVSGSLVQWLRDNLGIISDSSEVEELAAGVDDNGGAYIVPAFSGLYAPYWRPDARGALVGLTRYVNKHHLARAVLEATAYQTLDVVEAMNADAADAGTEQVAELRVDGGMVANDLLMQFQADILDTEVIAPAVTETTALGAAYAAGIAVGFWEGPQDVADNWTEGKRWSPDMAEEKRHDLCHHWHKAVARTLDWVEDAALAPPTEVEPGPDAG